MGGGGRGGGEEDRRTDGWACGRSIVRPAASRSAALRRSLGRPLGSGDALLEASLRSFRLSGPLRFGGVRFRSKWTPFFCLQFHFHFRLFSFLVIYSIELNPYHSPFRSFSPFLPPSKIITFPCLLISSFIISIYHLISISLLFISTLFPA